MKKTAFIFVLFIASLQALAQDQTNQKGLARTYKRQGIEIYILSEPLRDYEVTGKVSNEDFTDWANAISGEETKRTLTESIDVLITNANRKAKKGKFSFDAIITEDGSTGTCIKFK